VNDDKSHRDKPEDEHDEPGAERQRRRG